MKFDLNCDLGEGEPPARTAALLLLVTSANVACGGHAGTVISMRRCVQLAQKFGVRLGAHPGLADGKGFGRAERDVTPDELELCLLQQVSALQRIARAHGVRLHHLKLHGALYHAVENNPRLARRYVETVLREWPRLKLFTRAGGRLASRARRQGLGVWEEAFLDRGYRDDGTLVPRSEPGALLTSVRDGLERWQRLRAGGGVLSVSGKNIPLRPQTLCLHSDTPGAVRLARAVARLRQA